MEIAPRFTSADWNVLDLSGTDAESWSTAIAVFHSRIHARYIEPAEVLVAAEANVPAGDRRFGFAVMALSCLLVECLHSFRMGYEDTGGQSRTAFCEFLTQRPGFREYFDQAAAVRFYTEFRCGILHQAEIQGSGRVWSVGPLVRFDNGAMIVNRNEFHRSVKAELELYVLELADPAAVELRANFRRKMAHIAR